jgi:hypothetical protein
MLLLETVNFNVEVSLCLWVYCIRVLKMVLGSTVCLCWRAGHPSDHDEHLMLLEGEEG